MTLGSRAVLGVRPSIADRTSGTSDSGSTSTPTTVSLSETICEHRRGGLAGSVPLWGRGAFAIGDSFWAEAAAASGRFHGSSAEARW